MEFSEFELTGLKVFYRANENGGGMHFGQDYVQIVRERYGVLNTIYEFCSGPAFIGFSLLNSGLCNRLILSDIHTPVAESVEKTITENGLKNVKFFNMSGVSELPESDIDLVVSNPPHFSEHKNWLQKLENRIYLDTDWRIHREFYKNIGAKLSHNGKVLIQENAAGSSVSDFEQMIKESGLTICDVFEKKDNIGNDLIYYIEIKKDG